MDVANLKSCARELSPANKREIELYKQFPDVSDLKQKEAQNQKLAYCINLIKVVFTNTEFYV